MFHLYMQTTEYRSSPLDKIDLLIDAPFTEEFHDLARTLGVPFFFPKRSAYTKGYSFGPVTILTNPRYYAFPTTKIIINSSEGRLSFSQILDWVEVIVGTVAEVRVRHVDHKIGLKSYNNFIIFPCYNLRFSPVYG